MSELPPWREVTPDDFLQATYWETSATQRALLQARDAGQLRLRVIFRESKDLKPGSGRDPLWLFDYRFSEPYLLWDADEVVIETRDGRRHVVERSGTPLTIPLGHLDAQKAEEGTEGEGTEGVD
ncbi:hypothetical protein [Methylobacterium nigriterrae]|uniref:hypothetical protein n=1 Tax=Methylobacterium nigriterrae TaxID=3127512 RepID=UPI003013DC36